MVVVVVELKRQVFSFFFKLKLKVEINWRERAHQVAARFSVVNWRARSLKSSMSRSLSLANLANWPTCVCVCYLIRRRRRRRTSKIYSLCKTWAIKFTITRKFILIGALGHSIRFVYASSVCATTAGKTQTQTQTRTWTINYQFVIVACTHGHYCFHLFVCVRLLSRKCLSISARRAVRAAAAAPLSINSCKLT